MTDPRRTEQVHPDYADLVYHGPVRDDTTQA